MARDEGTGAPDPGADDAAEAEEKESDADDTEGQALTWKVRKPIPEVEEDAEGHSIRPSPEQVGLTGPGIDEAKEDTEGNMPWSRVSPEGTEEENAKGNMPRQHISTEDEDENAEGQARRLAEDEAEDDTEGQGRRP